jgi:predicted nucleotidyltransferase
MLKCPPLSPGRVVKSRDAFGSPEVIGPESQAGSEARDQIRHPQGPAPRFISAPLSRGADARDAVLAELIGEVRRDTESVGALLIGSRVDGSARIDSDYDLVWIVEDHAYRRRSDRVTLVEHRLSGDSPPIDITYENIETLRRLSRDGEAPSATLDPSSVLVDKTGEIVPLITAIAARNAKFARELVAEEYDGYLKGFVHSLKSWSRGDDLGARAHAAESGLHLVRALFGLEGRLAPHPDQWSARLAELDAQGWQPGFFHTAVVRLLYAPDPPFQQMLERRVGRLMESRGVRHQWRYDLQRLRAVQYDEL